MAVEGDIQTALASLVSDRCYPAGEVPDSPTDPYIVFQTIFTNVGVCLTGSTYKENKRVQVDAYGRGYEVTKALEAQIKTAMAGASAFKSVPINHGTDLYDTEAKLHRQLLEFSIWT